MYQHLCMYEYTDYMYTSASMLSRARECWRNLGVYRTLPLFFCAGAVLEWFMINVQFGKETFCKRCVHTYVHDIATTLSSLACSVCVCMYCR